MSLTLVSLSFVHAENAVLLVSVRYLPSEVVYILC